MTKRLLKLAGVLLISTSPVPGVTAPEPSFPDIALPGEAVHEALEEPEATRTTPGPKPAGEPANGAAPGLERLQDLSLLSHALVDKAASGSAPAHEFRVEARMYRELLRRTMLSNRARPAERQLPRDLLLHMTRMSALLHAAADCKTGFVITCPADLMLQLRSQQDRLEKGLEMYQRIFD
ncbi:MAG: hypothetical protein U5S82_17065 [Gammaproteobacteria bacterium]|nr:hypothetical protein [Gammaproteobacteria bacterium]